MISNDHNVMVCKTPRPSDQDIEIAVQKIKVLANTAEVHFLKAKQLKFKITICIKNEYLEAKDVYAISSIEKIEENLLLCLLTHA